MITRERLSDLAAFQYDQPHGMGTWWTDPRVPWTRGQLVRSETPVVALPPRHIMFDPTDPLTYFVKGAGYRPY